MYTQTNFLIYVLSMYVYIYNYIYVYKDIYPMLTMAITTDEVTIPASHSIRTSATIAVIPICVYMNRLMRNIKAFVHH
jgi:hypothetical protein